MFGTFLSSLDNVVIAAMVQGRASNLHRVYTQKGVDFSEFFFTDNSREQDARCFSKELNSSFKSHTTEHVRSGLEQADFRTGDERWGGTCKHARTDLY